MTMTLDGFSGNFTARDWITYHIDKKHYSPSDCQYSMSATASETNKVTLVKTDEYHQKILQAERPLALERALLEARLCLAKSNHASADAAGMDVDGRLD